MSIFILNACKNFFAKVPIRPMIDRPGSRPGSKLGSRNACLRRRPMTERHHESTGNLFDDLPVLEEGEVFEDLLRCRNLQIERIVSSDRPDPGLYEQAQDEWVCLLQGEATLWIAGAEIALHAGDYRFIPARTPHRVLKTSREPPCIWLAVHLHPSAACRTSP